MKNWFLVALCTFALGGAGRLLAQDAFEFNERVAEGDPIANLPGQAIRNIESVRSSQTGKVAFTARYGDANFPFEQSQHLGLFLQDPELDSGNARLIADLTELSAEPSNQHPLRIAVNSVGTVAIVHGAAGLYVFPVSGPIRHVGLGDPAPVQPDANYSVLRNPVEEFLTESGEAVFVAELSDGRQGLFRVASSGVRAIALQGQDAPDHPSRVFGEFSVVFKLQGEQVVFRSGDALYLDGGSGVRTVVAIGQDLPGKGQITFLGPFAVNRLGDVALRAFSDSVERLLLWSSGELTRSLDLSSVQVPGFGPGHLLGLSDFYVDDLRRVYFVVAETLRGGIFLWRDGLVSKVVADGDASPGGGTLSLTSDEPFPALPPPPPRYFSLYFPRPNEMGTVAFEAVDSVRGRRPFLWRAGRLEAIDIDGPAADDREPNLRALEVVAPELDGTIVAKAVRCCDDSTVIYDVTPVAARRLILPYLAGGGSPAALQIRTDVEISNASRFGAEAAFSDFPQMVPLFGPPQTATTLDRGAYASLSSRSEGTLGTSFAEVEIEGSGIVDANAAIHLEQGGSLISLVNLPATATRQEARLLIDQSGSADTGFAVSNPHPVPIDLEARLFDHNGDPLAESAIHLGIGELRSGFVGQLFPQSIEADFLGRLEFQSAGQEDFAVAGLRQSHLLLSALQPIPELETPTDPGLSAYSSESITQVLPEEGGQAVAIATDSGQIHVITDQRDTLVVDVNTPLPNREFPSPIGYSAILLHFDSGGLLFAHLIGNDRAGVYLWHDGVIQDIFVSDQQVDGISLHLPANAPYRADGFDRNANGLIAAGGRQLVVSDGTPRVLLDADTPIVEGGPRWEFINQVQVDDGGAIYFGARLALGRAIGSQTEVLAHAGVALPGTNLQPLLFDRLRLTPEGSLLVGLRALSDGDPVAALARYSGGGFQPLLSTREAAPGLPGFVVDELDTQGFATNSLGETIVGALVSSLNVQGLSVFFKLSPNGEVTLFANESRPGMPGRPNGQDFQFPSSPSLPSFYFWSDSDALLFPAYDRRGRESVFLIQADSSSRVLSVNDAFPGGTGGRDVRIGYLLPAGFGPGGDPLVNAALPLGDGSPTVSLQVSPSGFQDSFHPLAASADFSGTRLESRLLLHNPGRQGASVRVSPTTSTGETLPPIELDLQPGQLEAIDLDVGDDFQGWIRVRSRGASICVQERLSIFEESNLVTETTVAPSGLRRRGAIDTRFAGASRTGFAISNPWSVPVAVHFTLETGTGDEDRSQLLILEGRSSRSLFLSELFPPPGDAPAEGIVRIESTVPVSMISLRQEGLVLTTQEID